MTADLGPAATPRPIPTPEGRMRNARLVGRQADVILGPTTHDARDASPIVHNPAAPQPLATGGVVDATPGSTATIGTAGCVIPRTDFATYLDRTERDQLDARAATAEQERDDLADDLQAERTTTANLRQQLDAANLSRQQLQEQLDDMATQRNMAHTAAAITRTDVHHDIARQLDILAADPGILRDWLTTCDPMPTSFGELFHALAEKLRREDPARAAYDPRQEREAGDVNRCTSCSTLAQHLLDHAPQSPDGRLGSPEARAQDEPEPAAEEVARLWHNTVQKLRHGRLTGDLLWQSLPQEERDLMVETAGKLLAWLGRP